MVGVAFVALGMMVPSEIGVIDLLHICRGGRMHQWQETIVLMQGSVSADHIQLQPSILASL